MNGDRYKEPVDALRRQAVVHGLEVLFSFGTGTGRYFMPFMWTKSAFRAGFWPSHIGSCVWYYLVRTEDPTIELACHSALSPVTLLIRKSVPSPLTLQHGRAERRSGIEAGCPSSRR